MRENVDGHIFDSSLQRTRLGDTCKMRHSCMAPLFPPPRLGAQQTIKKLSQCSSDKTFCSDKCKWILESRRCHSLDTVWIPGFIFSSSTCVVVVNQRFLYILIQLCQAHAHIGCIDSSLEDRCGWFTIQTATSLRSKLPVDRWGAFIHCSLPAFSSVPGLAAVALCAPNKLSEL